MKVNESRGSGNGKQGRRNSAWPSAPAARLSILVCLALVAVTLAAYWPVTGYPFINYDDPAYVSNNPNVQRGLTAQSVLWAFTNLEASFWHPITWLSHILDWQLFGANAGGHHLTSLLLHLVNTLLLFGALRLMTGAMWRSAFVAALFALHPLHVESVAWIAERKDVLSTFFLLLTLGAYARYVSGARGQVSGAELDATRKTQHVSHFYWLALLFFALGLMSKPMLVTLPFVLLLLDYWPLGRFPSRITHHASRLFTEKIPFFALTLAACVLTYYAEHRGGAVRSLGEIPLWLRFANAVNSYAAYLRKSFWPGDLAVFYPFPVSVDWRWVIVLLLILLAITFAVVATRRSRPFLAVGWFFFGGTLVPVIGLIPVGNHAMADRFTYIPLIGVFIMVAWGVPALLPAWRHWRWLLGAAAVVAVSGCIAATKAQLGYWRSNRALFERALAVTTGNYVAHCQLAMSLMEQGREAEGAKQYAAALQVNPAYVDVNYNLGNYHRRHGRLAEAEAYYRAELQFRPQHVLARNNLGIVLAAQNKTDEAIECFEAVLEVQPDHADARNNLGNLLATAGKLAEAQDHYRAVLSSRPDHLDARLNLARLLEQQEQWVAAAEQLAAATRLRPDRADLHERLGQALARAGQTNEASLHLREAQRIRRARADVLNQEGIVLARQGKTAQAIEQFTRASQAGANEAETHQNLGMAWTLRGNAGKAIEHYRQALAAQPDFVEVLNNLAWLLATHKNTEVRNGMEAVRLAERAMQLTPHQDATLLDTLAAAYAEAGRWNEAIQTAEQAVAAARAADQSLLASHIEQRLSRYQRQQPFHE